MTEITREEWLCLVDAMSGIVGDTTTTTEVNTEAFAALHGLLSAVPVDAQMAWERARLRVPDEQLASARQLAGTRCRTARTSSAGWGVLPMVAGALAIGAVLFAVTGRR